MFLDSSSALYTSAEASLIIITTINGSLQPKAI